MKTSWTIGKKLYTGVGALGVCLMVVGGYLWYQTTADMTRFDEALSRATKLELCTDLKYFAFEMYAAEKITILSGYDKDDKNLATWRERYAKAKASFDAAMKELEPTVSKPADKEILKKSATLAAQLEQNARAVQALITAGQFHEAQEESRQKNRALVDENSAIAESLVETQKTRLKEADDAGEQAKSTARLATIALMAFGFGLAVVVFWVVRGINARLVTMASELKSGAEQVAAASGQVSTAAQGLSQAATEQAASLEETSASMEEMSSMTRQTAENAQQVAQVMGEVDEQTSQSNQVLADLVTSMAAIRDSSSRVSKIIKTIDEIAFQTNILALNAAVEAARAGEAGMGFAVVADEVRNLAQRAAQAAKDTASLIEESSTSAQQGSERMEKVAGAIAGVTGGVVRVKGIAQEVNSASRQQTQGIEQVSQAIAQMEKVTQSIAATAEESAAASEELNGQAETSLGVVAQLEAMVGSIHVKRAASEPAPRQHIQTPIAAKRPIPISARRPKAVSAKAQADGFEKFGATGTDGGF
jgi:methyl-accepting chemotaxis protein